MIIKVLWFIILITSISSCRSKTEKIKPIEERITESVYAYGVIKSKNQYKVYSLVSGIIGSIFVIEGDHVKKGDVIIKLINTAAKLNIDNAALNAGYALVAANSEKLEVAKLSIEINKAKMDNDKLFSLKQKQLWSQGIGSENEMLQKEIVSKASASAYMAAKLRHEELKKQIVFESQQALKNLELSRKADSDYSIKSDVDGKVYQMPLKKGEMVNTLNPVAIIGDDSIFMIELQIDEFDINRVKIGQKIAVSMDSHKGQVFESFVSKINPILNEKTRSFTIEANFVSLPPFLYPNLTCEANIIIRQKAKTITIPRVYLLEGNFVIVDKNKKVKVKTGLMDYQKVEILEGLSVKDDIYKPIE